jgi:uncharacterized protein (TIGR02453 family)
MHDTRTILHFLQELSRNNNRDWFNANKADFEKVQGYFLALVDDVIGGIRGFDPGIGPVVAKDCLFRIYRDTRFAQDKTPYKTHLGAYIAAGGRKSTRAGYYIHLDAEKPMIAGGIWQPAPDVLKAIRQEIQYHLTDFEKIMGSKDLISTFGTLAPDDKLSRPPKGFAVDTPGIEYIKHRNYVVMQMLSLDEAADGNLATKLIDAFRVMAPLNAFLNRAVDMIEHH